MIIITVIKKENKYDLNINNSIIISFVDSATLLGIEIDNKLSFEKYVSTFISCYVFLSRQYIVCCIYICILKMLLNICFLYPRIKNYFQCIYDSANLFLFKRIKVIIIIIIIIQIIIVII